MEQSGILRSTLNPLSWQWCVLAPPGTHCAQATGRQEIVTACNFPVIRNPFSFAFKFVYGLKKQDEQVGELWR